MDTAIEKISIIVSKGSLEGIYPALIMANGARAEGIEANLFFTFFGLDAITKKRHEHIKVALGTAVPPPRYEGFLSTKDLADSWTAPDAPGPYRGEPSATVMKRIMRRGTTRSASTPANSPTTRPGSRPAAPTMPSVNSECVRSNTIQLTAAPWSQVPIRLIPWPK